jgi:squalene-associated FAD-dependent desaturase
MPLNQSESVIIVGAGWAGLSAALTLTRQAKKIILLEAAPKAGGRARTVLFGEDHIDNGQHILLGAYHHILTALEWLNIHEQARLHRTPLKLRMIHLNKSHQPSCTLDLNFYARLPLLASLLTLKGFTWRERFKIAQFFRDLQRDRFQWLAKTDVSIKDFLDYTQQPDPVISKLWKPIAIAALSTPIQEASAQIFVHVLKNTFLKSKKNSDLLFPKTSLSDLLPNPILDYLSKHNSAVFYHQRVKGLIIESEQCTGVYTATEQFKGQNVILATPPHVSAQLIQQSKAASVCNTLVENLFKFHYQPITTIYLRYADPVVLKLPMIGFINSTIHWAFDRQLTGDPNILSVVISGEDPLRTLDQPQLVEKITMELASANLSPTLTQRPLAYRIIREKRAAFSCHVGVNCYRPHNTTPLPGLWLAGDYTNTNYPATLEGAVQSGMQAAQLILQCAV